MNIPTIFTQPEDFYSLACYTYILSGMICGVVRWFHMCHPFDKWGGDFFYPARRQMTFFLHSNGFAVALRIVSRRPRTGYLPVASVYSTIPYASPYSTIAISKRINLGVNGRQ